MSSAAETPKAKAATGWTDKERLTYLFALIDNASMKFDYANTPRPQGRSVIACQRMVERLKGTLKTELEALQTGQQIEGTPKKGVVGTGTGTPRKRKANSSAAEGASPAKRGRKKKSEEVVREEDEEDEEEEEGMVNVKVKDEVRDEDEVEMEI
ncbi:hypothetical protein P153DRAFT_352286 [Dothidotthia symphoricarpi CBS 119687]|uniref:Uncharacterized protein n=1 Tax=Dothidotthia symphoricarpi CBS 119687 TaxID=1392245 RepID=A0A6A5ZYK5_9PLEO|nr:uncharacterized protein P153DRAFT_352286 [Dothidotthia symphoricarpi CBS 119687]KAF2123401.1 hypothetical protein P153DRAFT_352286 [Dothidotthia symphoricarpi CBS 119687]